MKHANAIAQLAQHRHRIFSRLSDPVAVHLEENQFGIGLLNQSFESSGLAKTAEFIIVVVKGEAHAHGPRAFAPAVELIGGAPKSVQRAPHALRQHREEHKLDAKYFCIAEIVEQTVIVEITDGHRQTSISNHLAKV